MTNSLLIVYLAVWGCSSLLAQNLPVGAILEARLSNATGSRLSHPGDPIEATVIAPVSVEGRIIIPVKSRIYGSVTEVNRLGLGLKHTTASLGYRFNLLRLPSGETIPVHLQLLQVETAKERVDHSGIVHGIHPIVGLSSGLAFCLVPFSFLSPVVSTPVWGIKSVIVPSVNPEIDFPAGTELLLRFTEGVQVPRPIKSASRIAAFSPNATMLIQHPLDRFTQRTYLGSQPSDWVNLVFLGNRQQIGRAFQAAGWTEAHGRSPVSLYRMYLALTKRKGYPKAPMNTLTLEGVPSDFAYQKSLNTLEKRHHIRLWKDPQRTDMWLGAAAEDVGLRFQSAHWTHSTNPNTESEQAKVVNDFAFTGCIEKAGLLPRPYPGGAPQLRVVTMVRADGPIVVIQLNDCVHPDVMTGVSLSSTSSQHGWPYRALHCFRDDLIRSNVFFMTYNTIRAVTKDRSNSVPVTATNIAAHNLNWLTFSGTERADASLSLH